MRAALWRLTVKNVSMIARSDVERAEDDSPSADMH